MSSKQTYCPSCSTTYRISVAQLTMSQGMVCCPKCSNTFNALSYLLNVNKEQFIPSLNEAMKPVMTTEPVDVEKVNREADNLPSPLQANTNGMLAIFDKKVENSNIDLKTYLNNLNYFSTDPIGNFPALNWSDKQEQKQKRSVLSYFGWTLVNILLFSTLLFQFFWFNPHYLNGSPIMSAAFNSVCSVFNCSKFDEQYMLLNLKKVKVSPTAKNEVTFSGELVNFHTRSLSLPIIRVKLKDNGQEFAVYNLQPQEYLIGSLSSIKRIPTNTPFRLKFTLPHSRKSFDSYTLEIIRP
ncbi:DUF3426 domain-containing protein [Acinetobacter tianfuensis]|uniref:DUF3426 domain-containing protein n=1 Tax=Acinetobacter tianfuensis TaxID=2419603 RepID=A0A3A8F0B0_9GAMM|nr:DUF3426 domain-containing protein [Acinetobacter tianfuensis]RKG34123.1 DUF3426 domain-containing protein [Acinetobacter tianfuensis]